MNQELSTQGSYQETETVIEPSRGWLHLDLKSLWEYRELLFFLAWRDIKVRYKQTALGVAWAVLQPLVTMVLFSLIFGYLAGLPSEGIPYPVFTYTALIPWQLFSYSLTQSSNSLVADQNLISKVYFPRLVIPISSVMAGLLDFFLAFLMLMGLMAVFEVPLTWRLLAVPVLVLFAVVTAIGAGLWLSALNVRYRDVRSALPFLNQFLFYATPIAYSSTLIPDNWRLLYGLNPMVGVVEGFRWAVLGTGETVGPMIGVSALIVLLMLVSGLIYFRRMEDDFADVI